MTNFDPKTTIERLLLKYPSVSDVFNDAAPVNDDKITIEEFCFANGLNIMDFFTTLNRRIDEIEQQKSETQDAYEKRIANDRKAVNEKIASPTGISSTGPASKRFIDPILTLILALASLIFSATAIANFFKDQLLLRNIFSINPSISMPHIAPMMSILNLVALAGCIMVFFGKKLGMIFLFAGAMFNDTLAVSLRGGIPYETAIALCVFIYLTRKKTDGIPLSQRIF